MKRKQLMLFAGMLMLGMAFFATSCSDDSPTFNSDQISITVSANEWEWSNIDPEIEGEGYFVVRKSVPQLTRYIFDNGVISVYRVLDDGVMVGLPSLGTYGYGTTERDYYTEYIGYEFNPGEITFFIETTDLSEGYPSDMNFELRMVW